MTGQTRLIMYGVVSGVLALPAFMMLQQMKQKAEDADRAEVVVLHSPGKPSPNVQLVTAAEGLPAAVPAVAAGEEGAAAQGNVVSRPFDDAFYAGGLFQGVTFQQMAAPGAPAPGGEPGLQLPPLAGLGGGTLVAYAHGGGPAFAGSPIGLGMGGGSGIGGSVAGTTIAAPAGTGPLAADAPLPGPLAAADTPALLTQTGSETSSQPASNPLPDAPTNPLPYVDVMAPVPEPSTWVTLAVGLALMVFGRRWIRPRAR